MTLTPEWHLVARRYMRRLSGCAISVWLTLVDLTLGAGVETVTISWSRLLTRVGCGRRNILVVIHQLERHRLIRVDRSRRPAMYRCLDWRDWDWGDDLADAERLADTVLIGSGATVHGVSIATRLRAHVLALHGEAPTTSATDPVWKRWVVTCSRLYRQHRPTTWDGLFRWLPESLVEGRALAAAGLEADRALFDRAEFLVFLRARAVTLGLSTR